MRKEIDIEIWSRKEHFLFFKDFENPFWGTNFQVDCSQTYQEAKTRNISFFALSLHRILKAVNSIQAFRLRIEQGRVYEYPQINVSATIARSDHTFGFSFTKYNSDFSIFNNRLKVEINRIENSKGLSLTRETERLDSIHFSAIPWIPFSGLSHPQNFKFKDSIPKISTGKLISEQAKMLMPISIHAHHALADGYHAGLLYQALLNEL